MYQTDHNSAWRAPASQGENFSLFPKLIVLLPSKCWRPSDLKTQDRCLGTSIYNIFVYIFTYIVWFIKVMINNLEWFEYWVLFTGLRGFLLIVTKAFNQTPCDAVALLSFRADASTSIVRKWCTTKDKDDYSNVNDNTRVTSIASFADYALPSQVLQPRLPVQSGGPAEAGTHQGRDDRFLSFFSKY